MTAEVEQDRKWHDEVPEDEKGRWLDAARHFIVRIGDHVVQITRYDNHGRLIPDDRWVAAWSHSHSLTAPGASSTTDERYAWQNTATMKWSWQYKRYTTFRTPNQALRGARYAEASRTTEKKEAP